MESVANVLGVVVSVAVAAWITLMFIRALDWFFMGRGK